MSGPELVAWMEAGGWSVAGLARASGISERTIWRWRGRGMVGVWDQALHALRTPRARRRIEWREGQRSA